MPRAPKFTENHLKAGALEGKRLHIADTPTLYFDCSPKFKGGKITGSWTHRYSKPDKSGVAEKSLGRYPAVTLEMAKNRVAHSRTIMLRDKIDPYAQETSEWRAGEKTFGEVASEFLNTNQKRYKTDRPLRDIEFMFRVHCKALTNKPLITIKASTIHDALLPLAESKPKRLRVVLKQLEQLFDYANANSWFFAENPARWKEKQSHLFGNLKQSVVHHAEMPFADVPRFIARLRHRQQSLTRGALALEFLILTGTRTGATVGMLWDEVGLRWDRNEQVDWNTIKVWKIAPGRAQAKTAYNVPLSDRAIEILKRQWEYRTCQYVFCGHRRSPLSERTLYRLLRRMHEKCTVHGFRTSFRVWIAEVMKPDFWVAEMCIGHAPPTAVAKAYLRTDMIEERAIIMQKWCDFCVGVS